MTTKPFYHQHVHLPQIDILTFFPLDGHIQSQRKNGPSIVPAYHMSRLVILVQRFDTRIYGAPGFFLGRDLNRFIRYLGSMHLVVFGCIWGCLSAENNWEVDTVICPNFHHNFKYRSNVLSLILVEVRIPWSIRLIYQRLTSDVHKTCASYMSYISLPKPSKGAWYVWWNLLSWGRCVRLHRRPRETSLVLTCGEPQEVLRGVRQAVVGSWRLQIYIFIWMSLDVLYI